MAGLQGPLKNDLPEKARTSALRDMTKKGRKSFLKKTLLQIKNSLYLCPPQTGILLGGSLEKGETIFEKLGSKRQKQQIPVSGFEESLTRLNKARRNKMSRDSTTVVK